MDSESWLAYIFVLIMHCVIVVITVFIALVSLLYF